VPAASFAHVLDLLIEAGHGSSSTTRTAGIETAPLLSAPYASRWHQAFPFRTTPQPPGRRPARLLGAAERAALATMRRAGGDLPDDFVISELKSAFRRAARQLHPDAHPDADRWLHQRLGQGFAAVREAYVVLLRAAERRPN
jgi:hypothetical protein